MRRCLSPLLALSCLPALSACGGPQLDALTGEPASVAPYTTPTTRRTHPAVDGVQRFVVAMARGASEQAWQQLSGDTRKALQSKASVAGLAGVDLLRLRKLPAGDSLAKGAAFDPVAAFAVNDLKTLQVTGASSRDDELLVEVSGREGKKTLTLRFEGYRWRIHKPEFAP